MCGTTLCTASAATVGTAFNLSDAELMLCFWAGKVEDLGSGEYKAHFTATAAGSYAVSASVHGTSITGSPFVATVNAVEVDAACSCAAGDGVLSARSGHPVSLLPSNAKDAHRQE